MADVTFEPEVKRSLVWLQEELNGSAPSIAIECKKTQEARLSFASVTERQIEGLLEFVRVGLAHKMVVSQGFGSKTRFTKDTPFDFVLVGAGQGWLLVNFRFTKKAPRRDIAKGTNRCFALPVVDYLAAKEEATAQGRASLSYDWFDSNVKVPRQLRTARVIECARLRHKNEEGKTESGWDLKGLTNEIG